MGNPCNPGSSVLPSDESLAEENSSDASDDDVEDEFYAKALNQEKKAAQAGRRKHFANFSDLSSDDEDWVIDQVVRRFRKNPEKEKEGDESHSETSGSEDRDGDASSGAMELGDASNEEGTDAENEKTNADEDEESDYEVIEVDFNEPVVDESVAEFKFEEVEAYDDGYGSEEEVDINDTVRNLCDGFCDHLQTMDGGLKNEKTALSHRGVIMRLYPILGSKFENFWDRKSLNSWVKASQKEKKEPGTIKTYLGSICFFLEYLRDEMPPQYASHLEGIKNIIPR